ncbi:prolyl-tRNA synthetase associated domain-containing protein [Acetobacter sp. TBRC 12305]|uniref:Prolyl-tRNA synthetase associated domain-containing protein n=1 Tax=Acetobacter garciniae TaxID=2817435 RepID=A0A939HPW3_9PROT|nr:prolyl-tRNA synthetase associated domain-containing protein [Acetobacter garciniae]MBO1326586.1 prolyl-tRNA synthetase associated domain-containing protein [Acetobacter garciniae]MBX0346231.1 prolyl-tRNA synthetase associated domain-containing protein [Acetobacter garciniae]
MTEHNHTEEAERDARQTQRVLDFLKSGNMAFESLTHPPVHTVEEAEPYLWTLKGAQIKNFFLKDAKGKLFVVTCPADRVVDMKKLAVALGSKKLSFGKPDLMMECLDTQPGALGPLSLLADTQHRVTFAIDEDLWRSEFIICHTMCSTCSVSLAVADLKTSLERLGVQPLVFSLAEEQAPLA